jgi:hypothetical protein
MWARPTNATDGGAWPTPSANNYEQTDVEAMLARRARLKAEKKNGNGFGLTLGNAVKMWPTPNASDADKRSHQSAAERIEKGQQVRLNTAVAPNGGQGGSLNPTWVEWLMAWPLEWTVSRHWATVKSRSKRRSRGESSPHEGQP